MQKRLIVVFSSFILMFTFLYVRIGMIVADEKYVTTGNNQSRKVMEIYETRGQIYDTNFNPLVNQNYEEVYSVWVRRSDILKVVEEVKKIEGITEKEIQEVTLQLQSGQPFLTTIPINSSINGVKKFLRPVRYRENQLAKHIVGYVGGDKQGVMGVEKAYESYLTSQSEKTTIAYTVDGYGQKLNIPPEVSIAPTITSGVVLTIDQNIQKICEEVGNQYVQKGAITVMDTVTGELLAVASFPSFDIDNLSQSLNDTKDYPLVNKSFSSFTVGSTFKLVVAVAALEQGYYPKTPFTCKGSITVAGNKFNCHDKKGHGKLDMKEAIAVSCNPYFIDLALKLQKQDLQETATDLSFGRGYELLQGMSMWTARGNLPDLTKSNNAGDVANFAFGQGDLLGTPIQVTQMMSTIANGGNYVAPSLLKGMTADAKTVSEKVPAIVSQRVISKKTADCLKEYLVNAVMETEKQKSKPNNITAGGKTATAQTGMFYDDKEEKVNTWFSGFIPANNPKYTITVLVLEGLTGNNSAAPAFKEIADLIYSK